MLDVIERRNCDTRFRKEDPSHTIVVYFHDVDVAVSHPTHCVHFSCRTRPLFASHYYFYSAKELYSTTTTRNGESCLLDAGWKPFLFCQERETSSTRLLDVFLSTRTEHHHHHHNLLLDRFGQTDGTRKRTDGPRENPRWHTTRSCRVSFFFRDSEK